MIKFLGLNIWMGLYRRGTIVSYWSTLLIYKNVIASNTMSRNRFQELLRNIQFADNEIIAQCDRLDKIQPLMRLVHEKFQDMYILKEHIVVDESLIPWRGRLVFRQYLPSKAHKYGIKILKLCSASGYAWPNIVYGGRAATEGRDVGQAQKVCTKLTEGLRNEGWTLYIDSFYTSYPLGKIFLHQKTHVAGTLRARQVGFPKELMKTKVKKGEVIIREDFNGIVVMKWQDRREVRLLTTKHGLDMVDLQKNGCYIIQSRLKSKNKKNVLLLLAIIKERVTLTCLISIQSSNISSQRNKMVSQTCIWNFVRDGTRKFSLCI